MKRTVIRMVTVFLAAVILLPLQTVLTAFASSEPSEQSVYAAMTGLQSKYPEGMSFTNAVSYRWDAGRMNCYGCAAFAAILSDAAFGSLPVQKYRDASRIRVGDVLRVNGDSHSVIVLETKSDSVTVAEGNYGGRVHWGRSIAKSEFTRDSAFYGLTRYTDYLRGDVNSDGAVDVHDPRLVLIAYVNTVVKLESGFNAQQMKSADVNGNGKLDAKDVHLILVYYVRNSVNKENISWEQVILHT